MKNIKEKLSSLSFLLAILLFLIAFNFSDNPVGNWYQQFMPNLNGEPLSDVFFLDSLTGWAVTGDGLPNDSNYILKTTNGGDNWTIKFIAYRDFFRIKFINSDTGFACGGFNTIGGGLFKSTNGGNNWFQMNSPSIIEFRDMSVLNNDTLWLVDDESSSGGVYRTTNGGQNWTHQVNFGSNNPNRIYIFNRNIGFISYSTGPNLWKTINSGMNWTPVSGADGFLDMYFVDTLTGWKANGTMKKTTDGGLNWVTQTLPSGGNIITSAIVNFSNVSRDTIWGVGGWAFYPGNGNRGMIYRTTDGGSNWLFQIPDTAIHIVGYGHVDFVDRLKGWAYSSSPGVHTTAGGDPIFYTEVGQISSQVPTKFILGQNYPNPFNPRTVITYNLKSSGYVKLIAYDILGREVQRLVDSSQKAGEYEVDFMGKFSASGVYFYRMQVSNDNQKQLYSETKKMILLK
jgi:photosystem II stability/assembly factor-like uncharacterized protein